MNNKNKKLLMVITAFLFAGVGVTSTTANTFHYATEGTYHNVWQWLSLVTGVGLLGIGGLLYREERRNTNEREYQDMEMQTAINP